MVLLDPTPKEAHRLQISKVVCKVIFELLTCDIDPMYMVVEPLKGFGIGFVIILVLFSEVPSAYSRKDVTSERLGRAHPLPRHHRGQLYVQSVLNARDGGLMNN